MALKQQIIIEIAADGSIRMKTEGFKGSACEAELKTLVQGLGKVKSQTRTSEYYEQPAKAKTKTKTSTSRK